MTRHFIPVPLDSPRAILLSLLSALRLPRRDRKISGPVGGGCRPREEVGRPVVMKKVSD